MRVFPLTFVVLLLLNSCISEIDRQLDSQHVSLKKINIYPEDASVKSKWTIYENQCRVEISINKTYIAETMADSNNVSLYQIQLCFFDNKGVIRIEPELAKYVTNESLDKNGYFLLSNYINYSNNYIITSFSFPMYFFHNIKAGKNMLYAGIILTRIHDQDKHQIFKGFYSFNIKVPEIYSSTIICKGIELQNDSIWSPYHSDFSFGKGLPDVYWALFSPSADSNDYSYQYASTPVIWNSYGYESTDTIELFTYTDNENLMIGVYDYDRVFSDEYIGSWFGSFYDLKNNKTGFLSFLHISRYNYEFKTPVCKNCE